MTAVNVTVTPTCAWVSADSAMTAHTSFDRMVTVAMDGGFHAPDTHRRRGEPPPAICGYAGKISILPARRLIVTGAGALAPVLGVRRGLEAVDTGGLDQTADEMPDILRGVAAAMPGQPMRIFVAGWSEREDRALAFMFLDADGFAPHRLDQGHTVGPLPPTSAMSRGTEILWALSANGGDLEVESFHRSLARDQATWSMAHSISAVGGELWFARVDRDGVTMRNLGIIGATED